jgi:predicted acyl esterase
LSTKPPVTESSVEYEALGDGITFMSPPLEEETEITGPLATKLFMSSSTTDADLFLVFRVFAPGGKEVVFQGALDPHTPIAQGWLRASHRKLDSSISTEYRPYHTHDVREPLLPGKVYELDVEIWPTCIVVPKGYQIALTVRGKDYEHPGKGIRIKSFVNEMRGCGPFLHNDPDDRPDAIFGGKNTIHASGKKPSFVLVPIIPIHR